MIVTIDGPAGAGKSTVARQLAERLGFRILDTGAMYRAVVRAALDRSISLADTNQLRQLAAQIRIQLEDGLVLVDGDDITSSIRAPEVGQVIHFVADDPEIRARLVEQQREIACRADYVTEGRDQGTVAFPDADCKIFLTASPHERAARRMAELRSAGQALSLEDVLAQQELRDERDRSRPVGALRKAEDAVEVNTDGLETEQVVRRLMDIVYECQSR